MRWLSAAALALFALAGCSPEPASDAIEADTAPAQGEFAEEPAEQPVPATDAQCSSGEQTIFSCKFASGKRASVCVTEGDSGLAQYRFGSDGAAPELAWPATPDAGKLAWASVAYSGGGEAQISFARGNTRYIIYSRIIRTNFAAGEPNNPAIEDGVLVQVADGETTDLRCADANIAPVNVELAEKYTARADDLFTMSE